MSISPVSVGDVPPWCTLVLERERGMHATWLRISGELDLSTGPRLEQAIDAAHEDSLLVVIDPLGLTFVDCAGLRVIVEATARARRRPGWLLLVASSPVLDRLIELTDTQALVTVFDAHSDADIFGARGRRAPAPVVPPPAGGAEPAPELGRLGRLRAVP